MPKQTLMWVKPWDNKLFRQLPGFGTAPLLVLPATDCKELETAF